MDHCGIGSRERAIMSPGRNLAFHLEQGNHSKNFSKGIPTYPRLLLFVLMGP